MTDIATLAGQSAAAIGRALAAGAVSPVDLTEHLLDAIAASDDQTVFLRVTRDRALSEAKAAEARLKAGNPRSALDGVPIAWKDLFDMAGEVTSCASDLLRDAPPAAADASTVANATAAGMVSLGKVNLSEFAYSGLGLNPHFGTPRNPHDPNVARAPGGSSSGSGVAVAAGLAPCAIGTDTGGSVRIPSAFNGLVGHKTSARRIDKTGVYPLSDTLDTVGPLARSVEDCVLLDMALRGAVSTPVRRRPLSELRLYIPETVVFDGIEDAVGANFEAAIAKLADAGASIERGPMDLFAEFGDLTAAHGSLVAAEAYSVHHQRVDGPDVERMDPRVVARIVGGRNMSSFDLITVQRARERMIADLTARLDGALLAFPTTAWVAPEVAPLDADQELFGRVNIKTLRNTFIGNFLNMCGLALPSGTGASGMPTSLLLSDTFGNDERLLGYGLSVEAAIRA